jgi:hypothetical protein
MKWRKLLKLYNAHLEVIHSSISDPPDVGQSRDEDEPVEFSSFGGPSGNKIASKAEQAVLTQRVEKSGHYSTLVFANTSFIQLRQIRSASRPEQTIVKPKATSPHKVSMSEYQVTVSTHI